jgi:hypothetical protein
MSHSNDNKTTIDAIAEYSLIYDVKTDGLRDKTYQELKNEFSEKLIRCPCCPKDKVFDMKSGFTNHFKSKKHTSWKKQVQDELIRIFGHCSPPEHIINVLIKENRYLKRYVSQLRDDNAMLTTNNDTLTDYTANLAAIRDKLSNENDKLKQEALKTTNEIIDLKWEIKKAGEKNAKLIEVNTKYIQVNAKQLYFNTKLIAINKNLIAENAKLQCEEIENETFVDCD